MAEGTRRRHVFIPGWKVQILLYCRLLPRDAACRELFRAGRRTAPPPLQPASWLAQGAEKGPAGPEEQQFSTCPGEGGGSSGMKQQGDGSNIKKQALL